MALERISVFLTPELRRGLGRLSVRLAEPKAVLIRRAIREYLEREGIAEKKTRKTRR